MNNPDKDQLWFDSNCSISLHNISIMQDRIQELRKEYRKEVLDEAATHENPIIQFKKWFQEALDVQLNEPNAMMLATVNELGRPSARIVLLKDITDLGITFYTNYLSRKGKEIAGQEYACVTFFWHELERQIRFEGKLSKVDAKISDDYFAIRPRGSQIGAWSSPQSQQIQSRAVLEENERKFIQQFEGKPVPRPDHWGGYQLEPDYVEFWQGRENRMHDRICYSLKESTWERFRVAP